eukprot:619671-Amphidinium_carterae.1
MALSGAGCLDAISLSLNHQGSKSAPVQQFNFLTKYDAKSAVKHLLNYGYVLSRGLLAVKM